MYAPTLYYMRRDDRYIFYQFGDGDVVFDLVAISPAGASFGQAVEYLGLQGKTFITILFGEPFSTLC